MPSPLRRIPKTASHMGLAARALVEYFTQMQPGDLATYTALSDVAGFDVQASRGPLDTARKYMRDVYGYVFDVQINIGLVRLQEPEKIALGTKRRHYVGNYTGNTVRMLATTDLAQLTPLQKHAHLAEISVAAAQHLGGLDTVVRQIETQQTPQPLLIDPVNYKDVFKGF